MLLFLDIETRYNSKDYTLKKMSMVEYCRDPRFKLFGLGFAFNNSEIAWTNDVDTFIKQVCWDQVDVVSHNIKFDMFALTNLYGIKPRSYICTKSMSRAVLGKTIKNHSLSTLAEHFGLEQKGQMKTDGLVDLTLDQEQELATYCKHDVELCRTIYYRLESQFPTNQYQSMSQTIDMFVNPKLQLNVEVLENAAKEEKERRENIFKEIGIEKATFASNPKFAALLESRGFTTPNKPSPRQKDEDGKPIRIPAFSLSDTGFLEMLGGENEELKRLCEARVAAKSTLLETRTGKLATIGRTGLWPFDVEFSGADQTHRFSGGSGAGGNPQNFTRDSALRESVEAPEGYSLVVGDFSQAEFRNVAYLSRDKGLIGLVESGKDFYCSYASDYYGTMVTKSKEDAPRRKFGKESLLALGYNMGSQKFKKRVKINVGIDLTDKEAWDAVQYYRTKYPQVPRLWERLGNFIPTMVNKNTRISPPDLPITFVHEGFLLPSGLKVRFPHLRQEMGEKDRMEWVYDVYRKGTLEKARLYGGKLLENISQGLTGEMCKEVMLGMGKSAVGQNHDEILVICRKGTELATKQKLYKLMTKAPTWMPQIKLGAEVKCGKNWRMCK